MQRFAKIAFLPSGKPLSPPFLSLTPLGVQNAKVPMPAPLSRAPPPLRVPLAQLPALLVLVHAEHAERAVTAGGQQPQAALRGWWEVQGHSLNHVASGQLN